MKLRDVAKPQLEVEVNHAALVQATDREEAYPQVTQLLKARGAGIAACGALRDDERRIVDVILGLLDTHPDYRPTENVAALIDDIVRKLDSCKQSQDWML